MRRAAWILAALALVAVLVIGLSQASEDAPEGPRYDHAAALRALAGAPPPLAALHRQESELVEGGPAALRERLEELRGYPIVINKWASWCTPCRAEFPVFQRVSARKGNKVAFLGIDVADIHDEAREFLAEQPLSYPSIVDDRGTAAELVDMGGAPIPLTAFVDRKGEVTFVHAGAYRRDADLEADIERYLGA